MPRFLQKFLRLPRYYFLRVKRLKGDPEYLARGFAVGVFMGNLPFVPQTLLLVPLSMLLRVSTLAAIISSVIVNNPFTVTLQYYAAWRIGILILPSRGSIEQLQLIMRTVAEKGLINGFAEIGHVGFDTLLALQAGGAVMGLLMAVISYFPARTFFLSVRKRRLKKHRLDNIK